MFQGKKRKAFGKKKGNALRINAMLHFYVH